MISVWKNIYIDKLDDIVNKYKNTYHGTIKVKPIDVKSSTYIDSNKEINNIVPKFKVGNNVRISKYKNVSAKGYVPNWSGEVFVIKKVESTLPWMLLLILKKRNCWNVLWKRITKKQIKKNSEMKKWLRVKVINYMLKKAMIVRLIVWWIKKT